jgi:hypothetical protein
MAEFVELGRSNAPQDVNDEYLEHDTRSDDNDQAALEVEHGKYAAAERDVAHRFIDMINKLE